MRARGGCVGDGHPPGRLPRPREGGGGGQAMMGCIITLGLGTTPQGPFRARTGVLISLVDLSRAVLERYGRRL